MTMREKIARAAFDEAQAMAVEEWQKQGPLQITPLRWESVSDEEREGFKRLTNAVLTALREPSANMCEAGPYIDEVNPNVPPITPSQAHACWQAMIDAA